MNRRQFGLMVAGASVVAVGVPTLTRAEDDARSDFDSDEWQARFSVLHDTAARVFRRQLFNRGMGIPMIRTMPRDGTGFQVHHVTVPLCVTDDMSMLLQWAGEALADKCVSVGYTEYGHTAPRRLAGTCYSAQDAVVKMTVYYEIKWDRHVVDLSVFGLPDDRTRRGPFPLRAFHA